MINNTIIKYLLEIPIMIKETKLFYPHIVKQYDNVGQMISDNNYTSYYDMMKQVLTDGVLIVQIMQYTRIIN